MKGLVSKLSQNKLYNFLISHDPTAFSRWGATNLQGESPTLSYTMKSRRYDAFIDILPPHYGNNEKSDKFQIYYWERNDGPVEVADATEEELIATIDRMVDQYEAPIADKDTQGVQLWEEILALVKTRDPTFFQKWRITQIRNNPSREFSNNCGPEDWTGTQWDDKGVFAFQIPHSQTTDLWVEIDGRFTCNQSFKIEVNFRGAELERLDEMKPQELVSVLERLLKKYQSMSAAELEAPFR